MAVDDDLSAMLPAPPPPRATRRDATIEAALRRFDGTADVPGPVTSTARPGWLRTPQSGLLASAVLLAVIGVPATLIVLRDQTVAPVREASPVAVPAAPLPPAISVTAAPAEPSSAEVVRHVPTGDVVPAERALSQIQSNMALNPLAEAVTQDRAEPAGASRFALPPPPPPAPPPPPVPAVQAPATPPASAKSATDGLAAEEVVVTGARRQSDTEVRGDMAARTRRERAGASLGQLDAAITRHPRRVDAFLERAIAYRQQGKLDLALADLNRAYRIDANDPRILRQRSELYRQMGDRGRAKADEDRLRALGTE